MNLIHYGENDCLLYVYFYHVDGPIAYFTASRYVSSDFHDFDHHVNELTIYFTVTFVKNDYSLLLP